MHVTSTPDWRQPGYREFAAATSGLLFRLYRARTGPIHSSKVPDCSYCADLIDQLSWELFVSYRKQSKRVVDLAAWVRRNFNQRLIDAERKLRSRAQGSARPERTMDSKWAQRIVPHRRVRRALGRISVWTYARHDRRDTPIRYDALRREFGAEPAEVDEALEAIARSHPHEYDRLFPSVAPEPSATLSEALGDAVAYHDPHDRPEYPYLSMMAEARQLLADGYSMEEAFEVAFVEVDEDVARRLTESGQWRELFEELKRDVRPDDAGPAR